MKLHMGAKRSHLADKIMCSVDVDCGTRHMLGTLCPILRLEVMSSMVDCVLHCE